MAYLPPAGVRCMMDHRRTHLPTMTERDNVMMPPHVRAARVRKCPPPLPVPPVRDMTEEWKFVPPPRYPVFSDDYDGMRPYCTTAALQPGYRPTRAAAPTPALSCACPSRPLLSITPYGLPDQTFDVRRRSDWFNLWLEAWRSHHRGLADQHAPRPPPSRVALTSQHCR